jgi:hypothetical protein
VSRNAGCKYCLRYMLRWLAQKLNKINKVSGGEQFVYGIGSNVKALEASIASLYANRR